MKVLVVDDNPETCQVLKTMMEECGAAVTTVNSASAAVDEIGREGYDLLVSDIAMPGKDGYQLIQSVRGLPEPACKIPAIALTAYGRNEDRTRALRFGYQMFVAKPVVFEELMTVIANLV